MALSGNYKKITIVPSETEVVTTTISYPMVLSEDNPNYEKRGTTEEITSPKMITNEEIIENAYVMITGMSIEKLNASQENIITYAYRAYASQEDRNLDKDIYLHSDVETFSWDDTSEVPPYIRCYEHLSAKEECANLINA